MAIFPHPIFILTQFGKCIFKIRLKKSLRKDLRDQSWKLTLRVKRLDKNSGAINNAETRMNGKPS